MDALTVIHCLTSLDFGGVEKHVETVFRASTGRAGSHRILAIGGGGKTEQSLATLGASVTCLRQRVAIPSLPAIWSLYRHFRRTRPDVVHTHGAEANFHGLLAAKMAGVPVRIGEEIGLPNHRPLTRAVFAQVFRTAHRVIAISDAVGEWLISSGEVPPAKVVRLYNPVEFEPETAAAASPAAGSFKIAYVGRLEREKNPIALVEACAILRAKGIAVEALIIGDGRERPRLEARIRKLGLEEAVTLKGFQSRPMHHVQGCDVYVQPSTSEGFGLALVEAMGCGIPVVATSVGGAPEIVSEGVTGWLLPDDRPETLAFSLQRAVEKGRPALRQMGVLARESVRNRFIPGNYLDALEDLYRGASGKSRRAH